MKKLGLNEIRRIFKDFYVSKGSLEHESFSLVPKDDKSLLLINSGMAPLKPYFAGILTPPSKRMTTCQKCIRTGDLENVGKTARHGTFFEMLGSFSFGDYFKRESLVWGWEFITKVLEMPVDRLWASVYEEDDEAYGIWVDEIGISPDKVVRLGKSDNFWEIGIGPCGPCSEVYYDRGEEFGCARPDCKPGCDCDRYVEFWNHVFTQFNRDDQGNYTPLAHPNIDTGLGLERMACILQGTDSIFNVDTIRQILDAVCEESGVAYAEGAGPKDMSIRIITDHIRAVTFMIADDIIPSNEGRGYVLRRLLRRAAVHAKKLGIDKIFLYDLCSKVIDTSKDEYKELADKQAYIKKVIRIEEERFASTIDTGLSLLNGHIARLKANEETVLSGEDAFKLYDTYGMNPELTAEVLAEHCFTYDEASYKKSLTNQQKTSRQGAKTSEEDAWREDELVYASLPKTKFVGYDTEEITTKVIFATDIIKNTANIVFETTPFYAKGGGQIGDTGQVIFTDKYYGKVIDVKKLNNVYIHSIEFEDIPSDWKILPEMAASLKIDRKSRLRTARNHSATHLLHSSLIEVLGDHVRQAGSEVTDSSLRFDFTHFEAIGQAELSKIESLVNDKIDELGEVIISEMNLADAKSKGATALFDEKYGDLVRVVEMGDFSIELCGGTHVRRIGEIGGFKVLSEGSIGSGVRRIEAITGTSIAARLISDEDIFSVLESRLKSNKDNIITKVDDLISKQKEATKELLELKKQSLDNDMDHLLASAKPIGDVNFIAHRFLDLSIDELRGIADDIRKELKSVIIVLASVISADKLSLIVAVSDDLLDKGYNAVKLIKAVAGHTGGGGGGKADMAQAGGKDASKLDEAFKLAAGMIKEHR